MLKSIVNFIAGSIVIWSLVIRLEVTH